MVSDMTKDGKSDRQVERICEDKDPGGRPCLQPPEHKGDHRNGEHTWTNESTERLPWVTVGFVAEPGDPEDTYHLSVACGGVTHYLGGLIKGWAEAALEARALAGVLGRDGAIRPIFRGRQCNESGWTFAVPGPQQRAGVASVVTIDDRGWVYIRMPTHDIPVGQIDTKRAWKDYADACSVLPAYASPPGVEAEPVADVRSLVQEIKSARDPHEEEAAIQHLESLYTSPPGVEARPAAWREKFFHADCTLDGLYGVVQECCKVIKEPADSESPDPLDLVLLRLHNALAEVDREYTNKDTPAQQPRNDHRETLARALYESWCEGVQVGKGCFSPYGWEDLKAQAELDHNPTAEQFYEQADAVPYHGGGIGGRARKS